MRHHDQLRLDDHRQHHRRTSRSRASTRRSRRSGPESIAAAEWAALQARAKSVITTKVNPAYQAFADLYDRDLKAKCRQTVGVSAMPQGTEYYAFQVRQQTTTNLTPDEIHQIGLSEVARIRAEMDRGREARPASPAARR